MRYPACARHVLSDTGLRWQPRGCGHRFSQPFLAPVVPSIEGIVACERMAAPVAGRAADASAIVVAGGAPSQGAELGDMSSGTATLLPVEGIVFADLLGGDTIVTHMLTQERVRLCGHWTLAFDEEGLAGALVSDGPSQDVRPLDAVLKKEVLSHNATGEHLVLDSSGRRRRIAKLDDMRTPHRDAEVRIRVAASAASWDFQVSVFRKPRKSKQSCYWHLGCLYKYFGLATYRGISSKWVNACAPSWGKFLGQLFGGENEHMVFGSYLHDGCAKRQVVKWYMRCLSSTSISTCGLLALLLRWGSCSPAAGTAMI